jgi:hypothetical protein
LVESEGGAEEGTESTLPSAANTAVDPATGIRSFFLDPSILDEEGDRSAPPSLSLFGETWSTLSGWCTRQTLSALHGDAGLSSELRVGALSEKHKLILFAIAPKYCIVLVEEVVFGVVVACENVYEGVKTESL